MARPAWERSIKAYLRFLMQLEEKTKGKLPVYMSGHHRDSFYDEKMWDGFIVQKNNAKRNREIKAEVLMLTKVPASSFVTGSVFSIDGGQLAGAPIAL